MKFKSFQALLALVCFTTMLKAQDTIIGVVNKYTPVLGFTGCDSSILEVSSSIDFGINDKVLIIQMKGAEIDLSNSQNFGNIMSTGNLGNFEINRIKNIIGNNVYLQYRPIRSYDIGGKVQLVKVSEHNDVFAYDLTCKPWNGFSGGVLILDVSGELNMNGDMDVTGKGFSGGKVIDVNASLYHETQYFYPPDPLFAGEKGEGVGIVPFNQSFGRGKTANGGGGGNAHNAGGGGGGNAGSGGNGGLEYFNIPGSPTLGTNGIGGTSILEFAHQKIILGGGGGAGHTNDNVGTSGGNGGGIVIIIAGEIESNGFKIISNGENVISNGNNRNDGQGGGGAGGSVLVHTDQIVGSLECELNGGNGGDCLFFHQSQIIGPGGGGGGGKMMTTKPQPNFVVTAAGGKNGIAKRLFIKVCLLNLTHYDKEKKERDT